MLYCSQVIRTIWVATEVNNTVRGTAAGCDGMALVAWHTPQHKAGGLYVVVRSTYTQHHIASNIPTPSLIDVILHSITHK